MKKIYRIVYGVFVLAIIAVAVLFVVALFPIPGNFQVKIVQSGSMEPSIHTGSIVIIKPVKNYSIGDIITFGKDTKVDVPTTHRIIEMRIQAGNPIYVTKGDANEEKDDREVLSQEVLGKVFFSIPFAGYALVVAKKPAGFAALIIIPSLIILFGEGKKIFLEIKKMRGKKEERSQ
ncbi:MAG: signal peptidase I [Candidatus Vogelbacteria bacterium]